MAKNIVNKTKLKLNRLFLNNWGNATHEVLNFFGDLTMFIGPNGAGKTTVFDAIQAVCYGSFNSKYFNTAKEGEKRSHRSALEYLKGARKHHPFLRDKMSFYSNIVLEWYDEERSQYYCSGVVFEVKENEPNNIPAHKWFTLNGPAPEDEFRNYTYDKTKELVKDRDKNNNDYPRVCAVYNDEDNYIETLYDSIFGGVSASAFKKLMPAAISTKFDGSMESLIKDYFFPYEQTKLAQNLIERIQTYHKVTKMLREEKETLDLLEDLAQLVSEYEISKEELQFFEEKLAYLESILRERSIEKKRQDKTEYEISVDVVSKKLVTLAADQKALSDQLVELRVQKEKTDFAQKEKDLEHEREALDRAHKQKDRFEKIRLNLNEWFNNEATSEILDINAATIIREMNNGVISGGGIESLKVFLEDTRNCVDIEIEKQQTITNDLKKEETELKTTLDGYKNNQRNYRNREDLYAVKSYIEKCFKNAGLSVPVEIFSRTFDVIKPEWKNAIEGRLSQKASLIVPPEYVDDAKKYLHSYPQKTPTRLIDSKKMMDKSSEQKASDDSLYSCVSNEKDYIDASLRYYLGRIIMCESEEELRNAGNGVTKDCFSYEGRQYYHISKDLYTKYASIGKDVPKHIIEEKESEYIKAKINRETAEKRLGSLRLASRYEILDEIETDELLQLSEADSLILSTEKNIRRIEKLLDNLKNNEIDKIDRMIADAQARIKTTDELIDATKNEGFELKQKLDSLESSIQDNKTKLAEINTRYPVFNENTKTSALEWINKNPAFNTFLDVNALQKSFSSTKENLIRDESELSGALKEKKNAFNKTHPAFGYDDTDVYNNQIIKDFQTRKEKYQGESLPEYEKLEKETHRFFEKIIISQLNSDIKRAINTETEINGVLRKIPFGPSVYKLKISKADTEEGKYYEMLTSDDLDISSYTSGQKGDQISILDQKFDNEFGMLKAELMEKFNPPAEEDFGGNNESYQAAKKRYDAQLEKYSDYRTYLKFELVESRIDSTAAGISVEKTSRKDSGGETKTPKHVALFTAFLMLYKHDASRNVTPSLVMVDECFTQLDIARSKALFDYIRTLNLQLVVGGPDKEVTIAEGMDSLVIFAPKSDERMRINCVDRRALNKPASISN